MNKIKSHFHCLIASMKWIALCCMMASIVLICRAPHLHAQGVDPAATRPIPWPEIESLLSERRFVSQEELFQLLHQLYSGQHDMIHLDKPVIQKLAGRIESLLPLAACDSIALQDGTASIIFNQPQEITVPDSWHLASLKISQHLVLRLENTEEMDPPNGLFTPDDSGNQSVRFIIEQGYLQLDLSFLLNFFGNSFRDAQGSEILYRINDEKRISSLALIEVTRLTQDDFSAVERQPTTSSDEYNWIDIHHPDFPETKDIGITMNKISFLGMDVELLPDERIRFGDEEPRQDREAYHQFKTSFGGFKDLVFSEGKSMTIDYTRSFGYQFEAGKMFISLGFRPAQE